MHEHGAGAAAAQKVDDDVEHLRVQDRRSLKIFSSSGGAREHEDARADDGADAQRRQRPRAERFLQSLARGFGFGRSACRWTCNRKPGGRKYG